MNFSDIKGMARRAVHEAFAVPGLYSGPGGIATVEVTCRFHDRRVVGGDISAGYATIVEGVTRLVFNREELRAKGVTLRQRGRVLLPEYNMRLELDQRDPYDGPVTEKWSVVPIGPV